MQNIEIGHLKEKSTRRYDVDWLRVILFALLIWFHYAVFSLPINDGSVSLISDTFISK